MLELNEEQFESIVMEAWDQIPERFKKEMDNVIIEVEANPLPHQLNKLKLRQGSLFGLFDGVPKTAWGQGQLGVQPSKITIFREPILQNSRDIYKLKKLVRQVLMHEIAHYFGYSEDDMKILDAKFRQNNS